MRKNIENSDFSHYFQAVCRSLDSFLTEERKFRNLKNPDTWQHWFFHSLLSVPSIFCNCSFLRFRGDCFSGEKKEYKLRKFFWNTTSLIKLLEDENISNQYCKIYTSEILLFHFCTCFGQLLVTNSFLLNNDYLYFHFLSFKLNTCDDRSKYS